MSVALLEQGLPRKQECVLEEQLRVSCGKPRVQRNDYPVDSRTVFENTKAYVRSVVPSTRGLGGEYCPRSILDADDLRDEKFIDIGFEEQRGLVEDQCAGIEASDGRRMSRNQLFRTHEENLGAIEVPFKSSSQTVSGPIILGGSSKRKRPYRRSWFVQLTSRARLADRDEFDQHISRPSEMETPSGTWTCPSIEIELLLSSAR